MCQCVCVKFCFVSFSKFPKIMPGNFLFKFFFMFVFFLVNILFDIIIIIIIIIIIFISGIHGSEFQNSFLGVQLLHDVD